MSFPTSIAFGRVVGRYLLAVADTAADEDSLPDPIPARGNVTFTPVSSPVYLTGADAATVIPRKVDGSLNANGYVTDPIGVEGVWLVAGQYDVRVSIPGVDIPTFRIAVTPAHTDAAPLDLALAAPQRPAPAEVFVVNRQVYLDTIAARNEALTARNEAQELVEQVRADLASSYVLVRKHDGSPLTGPKVVVLTLNAAGTDVDDIAVYDSLGEV